MSGWLTDWRTVVDPQRRLDLAAGIVRRAGAVALESFVRGDAEITTKPDGSVVTSADLEANAVICEALSEEFPTDAVMSEEGPTSADRTERPRCWVVDPIDGTHHFARGEPGWSVMLALVEDGIPVLGVVARPAKGVLVAGMRGCGAWREADGTRVAWIPDLDSDGRLRVAMGPNVCNVWNSDVHRVDIRPVGTGLIALMSVFDEDSHAFIALPDVRPFEWDIAAPDAIIRSIGGRVTDISGRLLQYNRPDPGVRAGVIAAINADAHARLLCASRHLLRPGRAAPAS